jgi:hypothetical protein
MTVVEQLVSSQTHAQIAIHISDQFSKPVSNDIMKNAASKVRIQVNYQVVFQIRRNVLSSVSKYVKNQLEDPKSF